jgi:TonB family protein
MTSTNLASYAAQIALLVALAAGLPRLLGLRSAGPQYVFWRVLLGVCLLLPLIEPWRHEEMVFVPAATRAATVRVPAGPATSRSLPPAVDWFAALQIVMVAGAAMRLGWLGIGAYRLRVVRRRAVEPVTAFADLQQAIGVDAEMRWSSDVTHPVTFGLASPIVLLPDELKTADLAAQRAVVAHELHHVRRRDSAWIIGEEVVRSIFWFHPAMWWLISRVQLAREALVDELSVLATNDRRAYLDALLAFADHSSLGSTPAFSARRHLFHRVMLLSKEGKMSSLRVAASSCVLVVAVGAGSWGVVQAFPLTTLTVIAGQNPPPATRPTPGPLPPPSPSQQQMPPPPPPPPPPTVPPTVSADPIPQAFQTLVDQLHPVRVGPNVKAPWKLTDVKPVYPPDAQAAGVRGTVIVEALIDRDGNIADAFVLRSIPMLDEAAIHAVKQWRYEPTLLNGEPTAILMTVAISFTGQ